MSKNILLIKLGAIGDVLRTTSLLNGIKEKYNECKITWLTKKGSKEVLLNNPLIDEIIVFDENEKEIKNKKFDVIINLDEDMNVCELVKDIHSERIGFYVKNGEVLPTETAKKWNDMSALGKYPMNNILKKANKKTYQELMFEILQISPKNKNPIFNLTDKEKIFCENFFLKNNLKNGKITIGMNTGSGGRWQYKKWGIENTSKLIDGICEEFDINILLLGGPEEVERNNKIKSLTKARIVDAGTNNSIREFASLISLCDMVITSDSLAMHIAIALKKYVIVFFGPTSLVEIEIYGKGEKIEADIECVCCYLTKCSKSPTCMDKLTVDIIFKAVRRGMNRIRYS